VLGQRQYAHHNFVNQYDNVDNVDNDNVDD
jgi:hypothetical protein